jgi:hypothetical protein
MNRHNARTVVLSAVLAVVGGAALAQAPATSPMTGSKMSAKEMAAEKKRLITEKKVSAWPTHGVISGGSTAVPLTAAECNWLGGKIVYWPSCGTTNTKCVASNGHEMCIDELPKK